jgi:hypothetical protein
LAGKSAGNDKVLRQLTICGVVLIIGYTGLFCLLQSPALWYPLRPDPIRSLFPDVFRPINQLFPLGWVYLERTDKFALVIVPMYLATLALITGPVLYLLRRLSRPGVMRRTHRKSVLRRVFGFTLVIMLVLLFERGLFSTDIYSYEWYARIWMVHGASPYTHPPIEFPPDPEGAIYWAGWLDQPLVYGPAWLMISAVCYKVGELIGGSFSAQLLSLRLLAGGAHLLNAWLVWSIAGLMLSGRLLKSGLNSPEGSYERDTPPLAENKERVGGHPRRPISMGTRRRETPAPHAAQYKERVESNSLGLRTGALLFYVWNPLLLVEFAGNGHNDVVMLTFVLLAFWLHLEGQWRLAALALGLATLVKLAAVVFVPGYLWLLLWEGAGAARGQPGVRRLALGAWRGAQALAVMLVAWVALYLPVWEGLHTLQALVSGPANRLYLHTLAAAAWWNVPELLANVLGVTGDREQFMGSVRQSLDANLRVWLMGLLGLVAFVVTWRARTFPRALTAWGWVAIAAVVAQGWFWPWYASWAVVPAALAPSRRLRKAAVVFSVSALLLYVEEQILGQHFKLFFDWSGVFVMAPPLVYILFSWLAEVRRRGRAGNLSMRHADQRQAETSGQPELVH